MSDRLALLLAWASGGLLGASFFGGLWWTVRKTVASRQPVFWFFGSFLLRTGIALTGFYFVGRGHWERLVVCLIGFVMSRLIVTWLTRRRGDDPARPDQGVGHAP